MKNLRYLIYTLSLLALPLLTQAQDEKNKVETAEFEVKGVCGMCKERIENAALIPGVKQVTWDKESGMLTAIYKPSKVTELEIHQAIAEFGHDTSQVPADSTAYEKLPMCCAYRGTAEKH